MNCFMTIDDLVHVSLFVPLFAFFVFGACACAIKALRIARGTSPRIFWWDVPMNIAMTPACIGMCYVFVLVLLNDHGHQLFCS